jgi:hypothetical protein
MDVHVSKNPDGSVTVTGIDDHSSTANATDLESARVGAVRVIDGVTGKVLYDGPGGSKMDVTVPAGHGAVITVNVDATSIQPQPFGQPLRYTTTLALDKFYVY